MPAFTAAQALEMAMQIEANGEAFYNAAAAKATDGGVKATFQQLARDEAKHHAAFRKMAGGLVQPGGRADPGDDDYRDYLRAMLEGHIFAGSDKALAALDRVEDARSALQGAIGLEKDTLLFYYDLREMVGESDRDILTDIIHEEKSHVHRLAAML